MAIQTLSAEVAKVAKPHQWNVKETTAFPRTTVGAYSYFKCMYINFDNDNDRSYRRHSITNHGDNLLYRIRYVYGV